MLEKIFQKTFEKPLDKLHKVWYNISVKGNAQQHDFSDSHSIPTYGSARMENVKEPIKKLEKVFTNPLTNTTKCGII